jgi:hypothetical protein
VSNTDRYVEDRLILSQQTCNLSQLLVRVALVRTGLSVSSVVQVA